MADKYDAFLDSSDVEIDAFLDAEDAVTKTPTLSSDEIEARRQAAMKSMARAESPILSKVADVMGGLTSTARGALNLFSKTDTGEKLGDIAFPTAAVDKDSWRYTAGQVADPVAMAAGVKGYQAAQAGAKVLPKIGQLAAKSPVLAGAIGGAGGGAAVGALSDDSTVGAGAITGGLLGGALPAAAKGAGALWDRFSGTAPALKAKSIVEEAYGGLLPAARQLWRGAPADVTATQAAAPVGSTKGAAMGQFAKENLDAQFYGDVERAQAAARRADVSAVAGGQTQTAAQAAQKGAKAALNAATTPLRETELNAANTARNYLQDFAERAKQKGESLVSALQNQWKLSTDEARAMARFAEGKPGWISNADYAAQAREAADIFSKVRGQRFIEKDFLEYQAKSLAAHGVTPIDTAKITRTITNKLNDPKLAGNSIAENAMKSVADEIATWTAKGGGIIDAQALYSIRKNAVNSAIERQLSGADPKTKQKVAAGVLKAIQPLIDDAIEAAGGTGWRNYLQQYSEGMNLINRQKLGATALELLDKNPKRFMRLVQNEDPKLVRKLFETESSITKAMGADYWPLAKAASQMERDAELAKRAVEGRKEFANLLVSKESKFWMPRFIDMRLALIKEAGDIVEARLNKAMLDKLKVGLRSGKDMETLLNTIPATERNKFLNLFYMGTPARYAGGEIQAVSGEQQ